MVANFKRALVTGGAGFIGSHLVETLVRRHCEVVVLDDLSSGHLSNLESVRKHITFVRGDIRDTQILNEITPGCDIIFHLAAVVSVTRTVAEPVASTGINDLGAVEVLDAARRHHVGRAVLSSSSAVYGDDPELPKTESMTPSPASPYAVQKLTNEFYSALYHRLYGVQTTCLRYFNVYGPRQDPSSPYSGVISIFMRRALENQAALIYGDGCQTRDFVHVEDVVQANLLAAANSAAAGQVFNIGTGRSVQINAVWQLVAGMAGCQAGVEYMASRPGDIRHSLADIARAEKVLDFRPAVQFEMGLQRTFAWYRDARSSSLACER